MGTLRFGRRRELLVRVGAWTAVVAGPVALVVACATPRTVVSGSRPEPTATVPVRTADPSGVAVLFCDLWLRSDADAPDGATAVAVRSLAPDVALPSVSGAAPSQSLASVVAVRSERLEGDSWSVVVAARFVGDQTSEGVGASSMVKYFAVPVLASASAGGAGGFTVTGEPAQVAGPSTILNGSSRYERRLPSDGEVVTSLEAFFGAYLAGVGEVGRYLSPQTQLTAVSGTGYSAVRVEEVFADSQAADGPVPRDGSRVRVQVRVTALGGESAEWPLSYALTLTARSGRWEVTSLDAGARTTAPAGGEKR
ncbi:conjugal transfer protein [Streptomyces sp. NPDC001493]